MQKNPPEIAQHEKLSFQKKISNNQRTKRNNTIVILFIRKKWSNTKARHMCQ